MIKIICVGKIKEKYLNEMINDYTKRISKYHKLQIIEVNDGKIEDETSLILKQIKKRDYVISLAIEGKKVSSEEMSSMLEEKLMNYSSISLVIGASNGLSKEIKEKSNMLLSFSSLTFPHGLFRAILLEQIYRSFKIMNNETYHK